jgi:hypothetical protein
MSANKSAKVAPVATVATVAPTVPQDAMAKAKIAYATMTAGQKAKLTKEMLKAGLAPFAEKTATLTFKADSDYSKMTAGQKAAFTKWREANGLASAKPKPVSLLETLGIMPKA